MQRTSTERYGTAHPSESEEIKRKMRSVLANKTDEQWKETNTKRQKTCLERYGVSSVSKIPEIVSKAAEHNRNKSKEERDDITRRTMM